MFRLSWELRGQNDRREACSVILPLTCTLSHGLAEVAQVFSRETVRLHTLTLEQLGVAENEYKVTATLVRYERDGL